MPKNLPRWDADDVESLRPFSKIRLVAVDLDGTFVTTSQLSILEVVKQYYSRATHSRSKIQLTFATGRALAGALPLLLALPLPRNLPVILYNGSVIVKAGTLGVIECKQIPAQALRAILRISSELELTTLAYSLSISLSNPLQRTEDQESVIGWSSIPGPSHEGNGIPVRWERNFELENEVSPSAILIHVAGRESTIPLIEEKLSEIPGISPTRSSSNYIDIRPLGSNKGVALQYVANLLGCQRDEVLALGDNDNDVEMLQWAGIGIAIASSSPAALTASNYVCQRGAALGAVEVLRLIRNARRFFPGRDLA